MRPAVFLDRDDTLTDTTGATAGTDRPGDLVDPDMVRLLPGVGAACQRLVDAGFILIGISNQGCVARGATDLDGVHAVNERLFDHLRRDDREVIRAERHPHVTTPKSGCLLAGIVFCPYHPNGTVPDFAIEHPWRKPAPGMILDAADRFQPRDGDRIDLSASWLIGDACRDIDAGVAAGIDADRCLLLGDRFANVSDAADQVIRSVNA